MRFGNMYIFAVRVALNDRRVTAIVVSFTKERAIDLAGLKIWKKTKGSKEWKKSTKILWEKPLDMKQGKHSEKVLSFFIEDQKE